jgi:hypothetical protein
MRWVVVGLAVATLAVPASAASVDPRLYVLSQADVPRGYLFDEDNSLLLSKAMAERGSDARLLRRVGFQGAYFATYLNTAPPKWRFLHSGAYVFRDARGARAFIRYARSVGLTPFNQRGRRFDFGDEAWLHSTGDGTTIVWRTRRVLAYVSCSEMARHRACATAHARKQQRLITARLG